MTDPSISSAVGLQETSSGPPKKKSKKKAISATPAPTPSGLPANFFDSGVSKKFHPHGEEWYYVESDSEEEEGPTEPKDTPTTKEVAAAPPPSGLPKGIRTHAIVYRVFRLVEGVRARS